MFFFNIIAEKKGCNPLDDILHSGTIHKPTEKLCTAY